MADGGDSSRAGLAVTGESLSAGGETLAERAVVAAVDTTSRTGAALRGFVFFAFFAFAFFALDCLLTRGCTGPRGTSIHA